jgi:hypothetical protein
MWIVKKKSDVLNRIHLAHDKGQSEHGNGSGSINSNDVLLRSVTVSCSMTLPHAVTQSVSHTKATETSPS